MIEEGVDALMKTTVKLLVRKPAARTVGRLEDGEDKGKKLTPERIPMQVMQSSWELEMGATVRTMDGGSTQSAAQDEDGALV
jgi:hypothetical protein